MTRIELAGLAPDAAAELLGEPVGQGGPTCCTRTRAATPSTCSSWRAPTAPPATARLAGAGLEEVGVPPAVIASLAEELGLLSDDTRVVLRGRGRLGRPFEPDLAAAAADVGDAVAMDAFDELLGSA